MRRTLLLAVILICGNNVLLSNQCVNLDKCRCITDPQDFDTSDYQLRCTEITNQELVSLDIPNNVTELAIYEVSNLDGSLLQQLKQNSSRLTSIVLFQVNITTTRFSWTWLHENTEKLRLQWTNVEEFHVETLKHDNGTIEQRCETEHLKKFHRLIMSRSQNMRKIPECIPTSTTTLSLGHIDLNYFETVEQIQWPERLRYLYLFENNITKLSSGVFQSSSPNISIITLKDQPIDDGDILRKLNSPTLRKLRIQSTKDIHLTSEDFEYLQEYNVLTHLNLAHTGIKEVPKGMPESITELRLSNNNIAFLDISALVNLRSLKALYMERNRLTNVPDGLPASLEEVHLDHNLITFCHPEAFFKLTNLKSLTLASNKLYSMPKNIPNSITIYSVAGNSITDIGPESNYDFCKKCSLFNIQENPWACNTNMMNFLMWTSSNRNHTQISKLPKSLRCGSNLLPGLNNMLLEGIMKYIKIYTEIGCSFDVQTLACVNNNMKSIPKLLETITQIRIKNNPDIGDIKNSTFAELNNLAILELENIGLTRIPHGLPKAILSISLANNSLTEITEEDAVALSSLTNVQTINLSHNKLKTMPLICIGSLTKLTMAILKGNPLNCNCDLWPYATWANQTMSSSQLQKGESHGTCAEPMSVKGRSVIELLDFYNNDLKCAPSICYWDKKSPTINCSYTTQKMTTVPVLHQIPTIRRNGYWRKIDLSGLGLKATDVNLNRLYKLTDVKLSNNSFSAVPVKGLPPTVRNLFLDGNNISSLPNKIKSYLRNLTCLDLRNNSIKSLSDADVSLFRSLRELKLQGNPMFCDCKLQPLSTWISANQENPVMSKHELQTLKCHGPEQLEGKYIANLTEAEYCPSDDIGIIIGSLVGGVGFMIVIFIGCLFYWQRQNELREKEDILQGFRELLQQEAQFPDEDPETGMIETDKFRYDAFLSYSPHDDDSDFASKILDMLEISHGYKLCLHERDFIPGVGMADNIVECIGASKRIILLISHNFVESPWCQYEVQVALTELHQKRKSKLLIPILLEDISSKVEGSVKTFLSLIKGIKIPKNRNVSSWQAFWKEILEAMPHPGLCELQDTTESQTEC